MEDLLKNITDELCRNETLPKDDWRSLTAAILGARYHQNVEDGFVVGQGDCASSSETLLTGGLLTCVAVAIATEKGNFLCHVDSTTDPSWLLKCIQEFTSEFGEPLEASCLNCHGEGLNAPAAKAAKEAICLSGLSEICTEVPHGITGMHTVAVKRPGVQGSRITARFGKLGSADF